MRSLLECDNVIVETCTGYDKIDLKILDEVAQTATEATKVVSLSILSDENCLDFLEQKRNITDLVYSSIINDE